jgi:glycosyltransferase involved in cell wall biosynthesis
MDDYPFSAEPENYLLYVGRISPEKGVHHAIEAAKKLDLPLIIAAKLDTYYEEYLIYYRDHIEPHLSDKIKFIGEVDTKKRNELMSKALAFLHPVTWPEPFGLTLIEAMACGCPVVAFRQGSIPELVQEGKTGFVVETVDEMVEAIKRIPALSREECMKYSRTHFNARRMADEYEQLYNEIVNRRISSEQSAREEAEGKL